jgi:hypothetical protein
MDEVSIVNAVSNAIVSPSNPTIDRVNLPPEYIPLRRLSDAFGSIANNRSDLIKTTSQHIWSRQWSYTRSYIKPDTF